MFEKAMRAGALVAAMGSLAACEAMSKPDPANIDNDFKVMTKEVGVLSYNNLNDGAPMVPISVSVRERCAKLGVTNWQQLSGPSRYDFCDAGHTGTNGTKFAQRDYYSQPNAGGPWIYSYTVAVNCNLMSSYISSSIGPSGYSDVCT
jgi:hypothetical protein